MKTLPYHEAVNQMEQVEDECFPDPKEDMASLDAVCAYIEGHPDTLNLIMLFQSASISEVKVETARQSIKTAVEIS